MFASEINDRDLAIAEDALRMLAFRYRNTARQQKNPALRDGFERRAKHCERIAERIRRSWA
jgi:hypothetical protein